MATDWLKEKNIDFTKEQYVPLLRNLQANILKHHGRDHAWHIFLQFVEGREKQIKNWISTRLAAQDNGHITSAYTQLDDAKKYKKALSEGQEYDGGVITSFMLSSKGYQFLGYDPATVTGETRAFTTMSSKQDSLEDPLLKDWEPVFQLDIHAMLLLADDKPARLKSRLRKIREELGDFIRIISNQEGKILYNKDEHPIEHFGFEDGISQPKFLANGAAANGAVPVKYSDEMSLDAVLAPDAMAGQDDCFGSFVVFRKLEQNVKKFVEEREKLSIKLFGTKNEKLAGAMAVGRFENGTPVTDSLKEKTGNFDKNNFDYSHDATDLPQCPYHAHIRITNPRDKTEPIARIRIVRRGITYDEIGRRKNLTDQPEHGVGLYFISYQSYIETFEIMQNWTLGGHVHGKFMGIDPIAGQGEQNHSAQEWRQQIGGGAASMFNQFLFTKVVTMLGGEYFFAPSIPFLRKLPAPIAAV